VTIPDQLAAVFGKLRQGRHISRHSDPELFVALDKNRDAYQTLLRHLGYELICDPRDFFYLQGRSQVLGKRLRGVTLFMLIFFQHLEDTKFLSGQRMWEKTLLDRPFDLQELPHFTTTSLRREMMEKVGVGEYELHEKILSLLSKWGMLEFASSTKFYFKPPIYRFVNLCEQYASQGLAEAIAERTDVLEPSDAGQEDSISAEEGDAQ
jgi:chromosome condensin MukBEF MukE localization factor